MKQPNYTTTIKATITALSHDGRGIAQIDGKTTFIANALPNEEVEFIYTHRHNKYDEGKAITINTPSAERVTPLCAHFTICGGCSLQHMATHLQLQLKQNVLLEQLKHFGGTEPETILPPLTGEVWGYRRKARLSAKYVHKKQTVLVGFHEKSGRYIAEIKRCEILHPSVGTVIEELKQLIGSLSIYQHIPQIEVAAGDTKTALTLRHLQPLTDADLQQLIAFAKTYAFELYLQPAGPTSAHLIWPENNQAELSYRLPAYDLELFFNPTDFTQVNADINRQMIARALELLAPQASENILDLFCGIGNFTLPLARHCAEVVGVEGLAELIERAKHNAAHNNITNAQFYRADLTTDFSQAPWAKQKFVGILLDPPRTGALEIIRTIAQFKAQRIVYVSCNPATLARDAGELRQQGYRLKQAGIMDMFPHTQHVEAIALFVKE